jgi:hypothetical protein
MVKLIKDFFDASKERLKNPLVSAFLISWLFLHWKHLFILFFSGLEPTEVIKKIKAIDKGNENWVLLLTYWVLPLVIASFYVIILPFIMNIIDEATNKIIKKRKENVYDLLESEITYKQKLVDAENLLENSKAKLKSIQELNRNIKGLEEDINIKDSLIESQKKEIKELSNPKNIILDDVIVDSDNTKPDEASKILSNITKNHKVMFENLINAINNKEMIDVGKNNIDFLNLLLKTRVISLKNKSLNNNNIRSYLFTNYGQEIVDKFVSMNLV